MQLRGKGVLKLNRKEINSCLLNLLDIQRRLAHCSQLISEVTLDGGGPQARGEPLSVHGF
jgi:hypothetical protein